VSAGLFLGYIFLGFLILLLTALAVLGGWMLWRIFDDMRKP
jgi:hypothetical protein